MSDWHISKVVCEPRGRRLEPLGIVQAEHQPGALQKAAARWPEHLDHDQVQAGFHARLIEA